MHADVCHAGEMELSAYSGLPANLVAIHPTFGTIIDSHLLVEGSSRAGAMELSVHGVLPAMPVAIQPHFGPIIGSQMLVEGCPVGEVTLGALVQPATAAAMVLGMYGTGGAIIAGRR